MVLLWPRGGGWRWARLRLPFPVKVDGWEMFTGVRATLGTASALPSGEWYLSPTVFINPLEKWPSGSSLGPPIGQLLQWPRQMSARTARQPSDPESEQMSVTCG